MWLVVEHTGVNRMSILGVLYDGALAAKVSEPGAHAIRVAQGAPAKGSRVSATSLFTWALEDSAVRMQESASQVIRHEGRGLSAIAGKIRASGIAGLSMSELTSMRSIGLNPRWADSDPEPGAQAWLHGAKA